MKPQPMTPMQRVMTTLAHREPDRVPLFLLATLHGARELGLSIEAYFSRAEHVVEGQIRLAQRYGGDCVNPFFHAALEHEAWGGDVIFHPDGPPNAGAPVIQRPEDIDRLVPPRVADCPGLQRNLEAMRGLKAWAGERMPLIGTVVGPFSLPVMQMGFGAYLDLMHEQPERFERLMALNEAFCVDWGNAQFAAGATALCYFDPVSSPTIVPREVYQRTGHRVARRVMQRLKGPTATHLASGRSAGILDDLVATGTAAVGISVLEDLAAYKRAAAGRIAVIGALNGVEMRRWTLEQADAEVRRHIQALAPGGGFILSDNHGEIPWQVSDEVLEAVAEAVRRWGTYPLPDQTLDPDEACG